MRTGLIGLSVFAALSASAEPPAYLEKDLAELTSLFEGRWDNDRHIFFAEDAGIDAGILAPRQHIEIVPVELEGAPEGALVLMADRTVEGEATARLFHVFALGDAHIAHGFFVSAATDELPSFDELRGVRTCQVNWQRAAGGFRGTSQDSGCRTVFPRPEDATEFALELSEQAFNVIVTGGTERVEARMRRARSFSCWAAVLRGAEHGDSGEGLDDWDFRRGIAIHDQGGEAVIETDDRRVRLKLRDVDWPYGNRRASLTLYIYEGDEDRAVSYAWTGGGEDRIGINLRWLQASCTAEP